jgi:hypothetical protein
MGLPDRQRMTESAGPVTTATAPDGRSRGNAALQPEQDLA